MPKIRKVSKNIAGQSSERRIEFEVMYNQERGFYVKLPTEWWQVCQVMSKTDRNALHIILTAKRKYAEGTEPLVMADTESEVVSRFIAAAKVLIDTGVTERRIIMIFYEKTRGQYNGHVFNKEHEQIGQLFGLTYAIEISLPGGTTQYCVEREQRKYIGHFAEPEMITVRNFFSPWKCTIIDDTPENRAKMDSLYVNLKNLYTAIGSITESDTKLLDYIQSDKLLQLV